MSRANFPSICAQSSLNVSEITPYMLSPRCSEVPWNAFKLYFEVGNFLRISGVWLFTDGTTAVHRACCNGNHEALRVLIQSDADISVQDNQGRAPVHWAAIAATTECLEVALFNLLQFYLN